MRLYHFLNGQFGLEGIRKRRLKLARLNELNDPFEFLGPSSRNPELRRAFRATKEGLAAEMGLLCFSRSWTNPVQWSHYADRHRGLCLGFDIPDEFAMPVRYQSRRIVPDMEAILAGGQAALDEVHRMAVTKYSHWKYENEVRCFLGLTDQDPTNGLYFAHFDPNLVLREVIVGSESQITRAEVAEALGPLASSVNAFKARLAFGTYRVVTQRSAKFWH